MLKKKILKEIKNSLLFQKEELINRAYQSGQNSEIDAQGDEIDLIQAKQIANVVSQINTRDREKLSKIEMALKKIEDKSFGICEECGDDIAQKRLEMNPYFLICISCAEEKEAAEKKRGR